MEVGERVVVAVVVAACVCALVFACGGVCLLVLWIFVVFVVCVCYWVTIRWRLFNMLCGCTLPHQRLCTRPSALVVALDWRLLW